MIKIDGTQKIKGTRTNAWTGEKREVELSYYVKLGYNYHLWFYIEPGVTGYESFEFDTDNLERTNRDGKTIKDIGWSACAGTKDRWDSLFISAEEITKAIDDIQNQIIE